MPPMTAKGRSSTAATSALLGPAARGFPARDVHTVNGNVFIARSECHASSERVVLVPQNSHAGVRVVPSAVSGAPQFEHGVSMRDNAFGLGNPSPTTAAGMVEKPAPSARKGTARRHLSQSTELACDE